MPPSLPKTLLALSALTFFLSHISHVTASLFPSPETAPKVLAFDFRKEVPRNTPLANRLRKRQRTVTANLDNEQIAYVLLVLYSKNTS